MRPLRLHVRRVAFRLTLSRPSIEAGPAIVQLANHGEDDHNLRLQRIGGKRVCGARSPTMLRAACA